MMRPPVARAERFGLRRTVFATLVLTTMGAVFAAFAWLIGRDGLGVLDWLMLACLGLTLPWTIIGFWNAVIGLAILHLERDPAGYVTPMLRDGDAERPLRGRTALLMAVHDEDPEAVFRHLRATVESLDRAGSGDAFDVFVLSDTQDPAIAADEERLFDAWRRVDHAPERLGYRRRAVNTDHKTGNIWEWLDRSGADYAYFVTLDADSLMSGRLLTRLVRIMDQNPGVGILQTLIVGLPSASAFARLFQFGMRHGMRSYTTGSAWWLGDAGPYWGHNALIRTAAFMRHCRLPHLPGKPPLGGLILSHDMVEAALMRRAGYEVRVIPEEGGSFEVNPTTLPEFIRRDLRWCQGNMQYWRLLPVGGFRAMGRLQLALAVLMYLSGPAWLGFMLAGLGKALSIGAAGDWGWGGQAEVGDLVAEAVWSETMVAMAIGLFVIMMTVNLTPKLAGLIDVALRPEARRAYGGGRVLATSAVAEFCFALVIGPAMAVAQTIFIAGLPFGRMVRWEPQRRADHSVTFTDAVRGLWPQCLLGLIMLIGFAVAMPSVLPWTLPVVGGLLLAIPFAWLTARPSLGRALTRLGLCAVPEEREAPMTVQLAGYRPRADGTGRVLLPEVDPRLVDPRLIDTAIERA
jgi:membrane glycosyltransferase